MKFLLDNGADVNTVVGEFGTALQAAVYHYRPYIEMLLKYGRIRELRVENMEAQLVLRRRRGLIEW